MSPAISLHISLLQTAKRSKSDAFFGGQEVFATLGSFVGKFPAVNTSSAFDETSDALAVAIANIIKGADISKELNNAQTSVNFIGG